MMGKCLCPNDNLVCSNTFLGLSCFFFSISKPGSNCKKNFRGAAKNKFYLKKIGVTHVLNSAEGSQFGNVVSMSDNYKLL